MCMEKLNKDAAEYEETHDMHETWFKNIYSIYVV